MANLDNLIRFKKGDPRINRKGKPRNAFFLKNMARTILCEVVSVQEDGSETTRIESLLRTWMNSGDFKKQLAAVQYAYGKPTEEGESSRQRQQRIIEWQDSGEFDA